MQVNVTVNIRDDFLSCSVTVVHKVIAIYRAVINRFDGIHTNI